jgi:trimeric autotransporter adhesin
MAEEKIMKRFLYSPSVLAGVLLLGSLLSAQQAAVSTSAAAVVPRLVNFSGKAIDQGKALSGVTGITFSIYSDESGGSPLWMETQNVQVDSRGNYTAQLGATKSDGLPLELFASGEARWLAVRVNGGEEQARVLLLSVPYALKAADSQTLGGLPASAFMLAGTVAPGNSPSSAMSPAENATAAISGTGTTDFLPLWTNSTGTLGNSVLFQSGSGTTAKIGINTTTPAATLDVNGGENVHGILNMTATGTATATAGKNSQPQDFSASVFNKTTATAVTQKFQWQAEPVGNDTATASGAMSLLYATGTAAPAETGLKINSKGLLTFAAGQTFPGTGKGTVTSVGLSAPTTDFTVSGSPVTGAGTLALKWTTAPTSADTANAIVKRDGAGAFQGGRISGNGVGDFGVTGQTDTVVGVGGFANSGYGMQASSNTNLGLFGESNSSYGIEGYSSGSYGIVGISGYTAGIVGISDGSGSTTTGYGPDGVVGVTSGTFGTGVVAISTTANGTGFLGVNQAGGQAGFFDGSVDVAGALSKSSGTFKIDHPQDPANKYLYHSFVESPDMMNIYNGDVTLDANGLATVTLPSYFESLNQDFRYQLTAIGGPGPNLHIAAKVQNNTFKIGGGQPGMEVSWQVTGVRHDSWANAHRVQVEVEKPAGEKGLYIHPELFGAPQEKSIASAHHPEISRVAATSAAKRIK